MKVTAKMVLPDVGDDHRHHRAIMSCIAERYGGCTSYRAAGLWSNKDGRLVSDNSTVIEAGCSEWSDNHQAWWIGMARTARMLLDQACIYISVRPETSWVVGADNEVEV